MNRLICTGLALAVTLLAGCATRSAVLSDELGGYRQDRIIYACDDDQLCGSKRMYDMVWLSCGDFPVDYRARVNHYTPDRTKYLLQEEVLVATPRSIFNNQ